MKTCCRCKETKTEDAFSRDLSRKDGLQVPCKACRCAEAEEHAEEIWRLVIEHFEGECADCHTAFHRAAYDLHHLDPKTKDGRFVATWTWARVLEYIKGCVLLCSNCHRIRHSKGGRPFLSSTWRPMVY